MFVRDGPDIYVDTRITFTQAILGGKVEVPTLSGKTQLTVRKVVYLILSNFRNSCLYLSLTKVDLIHIFCIHI